MSGSVPWQQQIELRAYFLWESRGYPWGTPEIDWFAAERELRDSQPDGLLVGLAREAGTALGSAVALLHDLNPFPR